MERPNIELRRADARPLRRIIRAEPAGLAHQPVAVLLDAHDVIRDVDALPVPDPGSEDQVKTILQTIQEQRVASRALRERVKELNAEQETLDDELVREGNKFAFIDSIINYIFTTAGIFLLTPEQDQLVRDTLCLHFNPIFNRLPLTEKATKNLNRIFAAISKSCFKEASLLSTVGHKALRAVTPWTWGSGSGPYWIETTLRRRITDVPSTIESVERVRFTIADEIQELKNIAFAIVMIEKVKAAVEQYNLTTQHNRIPLGEPQEFEDIITMLRNAQSEIIDSAKERALPTELRDEAPPHLAPTDTNFVRAIPADAELPHDERQTTAPFDPDTPTITTLADEDESVEQTQQRKRPQSTCCVQ